MAVQMRASDRCTREKVRSQDVCPHGSVRSAAFSGKLLPWGGQVRKQRWMPEHPPRSAHAGFERQMECRQYIWRHG